MTTSQITVLAHVNAPADMVWQCYTEPAHITQWNFADPSWQCPWATNDLRVGGKYVARMEAKDGSFGFEFEAVYDTIELGKHFTYTMPNGRKVTTTLEPKDGGTLVTTIFDAENENPLEMQRDGWQAILHNFVQYVEAL